MDPQPNEDIQKEDSLPELTLTQTLRSPEAVVKVDSTKGMTEDKSVVKAWGEYSIVISAGSHIQLLDNAGRPVTEFGSLGNPIVIDWSEIRDRLQMRRIEYISSTSNTNLDSADITLDNLPSDVRAYVKTLFKGERWLRFPTDDVEIDVGHPENIEVVSSDSYILIYDIVNKVPILYLTQDLQGRPLPPRNWKRVDPKNWVTSEVPKECVDRIKLLQEHDYNQTTTLNDSTFAKASSTELKLYRSGEEIFEDKLGDVGKNVCVDPQNPNIVYYCAQRGPRSIIRVDLSKGSGNILPESLDIPRTYTQINGLLLDPSGNFFLFRSGEELVVVTKDTLQEVEKIPDLFDITFDTQGRIRGIDPDGHLVIYDTNFQQVTQEIDKRRVARIASGLGADLFAAEGVTPVIQTEQFQHLEPVKENLGMQFSIRLQAIDNLTDMSVARDALAKLHTRLQVEGLQPIQITFITDDIQKAITERERTLAAPVVAQGLDSLHAKLAGSLTITSLGEVKEDIARLKLLEGYVDEDTRVKIRAIENQLQQQTTELFRTEGEIISRDVDSMVTGVKAQLEAISSMIDFSDWQEFTLPQLTSRLGMLAHDCPLEAHEIQQKILAARRQLQDLSREFESRFKEQYAQVRERASDVMGERIGLMRIDVDSVIDRIRARGFSDRNQADTYIRSSDALSVLRTEIAELANQNPDAAKELDRELKSRIANVLAEIERGGLGNIAETGQQMVLFGKTLFPRWEGKIQEKVQRHVDLVFIPDEQTKGPGVSANMILGDVGVMEIDSRGKLTKKRLYEDMHDEDERRYGGVAYKGKYAPSSYVSQAEYREVKQDYADWAKGDASVIRKTLSEKRQELRTWYKNRQPPGETRVPAQDETWSARYRKLLRDYSSYAVQKHVVLLTRIDHLRAAPEEVYTNGSGYVPEWQSHWTIDETTERYLEEMAQISKMQLDLQEGLLNLKGHAGTGKDVLVKMFCNRTNRPYFAIDCSKWTTEFELSEDVVLEAEDGASRTVKVPSVVLNAITTPGAVMYFNEINAMPEQAQIFLHGLMDEKRTLTLKTSSGKAIKTHGSVLLMGSMNPGYPGTFDPQFATKSRMVGLDIEYPSLYKEKSPDDLNPNPQISSAEALRIARQVDSFADLTYEANPEHNEFVRLWDRHINRIENGAPDLTIVQEFDMNVVLSMVEFAQKLREGFILKFEKARAASIPRGTLLVDQPMTGREMRRMAYALSQIPADEKAKADAEAVTRNLIERFFISHIDKKDEKDQIRTAMATWTSFKRPVA